MIEVLLIVIVFQLGYIIHTIKALEKEEREVMDYSKIMPQYIGKECEMILKEALYAIDVMHSITGKTIDCDENWVVIETTEKKKSVLKMIQLSMIVSLKEIKYESALM